MLRTKSSPHEVGLPLQVSPIESWSMQADSHNPLGFCKAFRDNNAHVIDRGGHGHMGGTALARAEAIVKEKQITHVRDTCNPPVRLANRSNGVPLATIIEQGSHSTLRIHGSLYIPECIPPASRARRGLHTQASPHELGRTQEQRAPEDAEQDITQDHSLCFTKKHFLESSSCDGVSISHVSNGRADITKRTGLSTISAQPLEVELEPVTITEYDEDRHGTGPCRAISQSARSTTEAYHRPPPVSHPSIVESRHGRAGTSDSRPRSHLPSFHAFQTIYDKTDHLHSAEASYRSYTLLSGPKPQARNQMISASRSCETTCSHPPLLSFVPSRPELDSICGHKITPPPSSDVTHSPVQTDSVGSWYHKPRDVAYDGSQPASSTLSHVNGGVTSAQHVVIGLSSHDEAFLSSTESAHLKNTSPNGSLCSSLSTSYSGTVLGVDVDLDVTPQTAPYEVFSRPRTPAASPWFTPQMAELERQASLPESPEVTTVSESHSPCRLITSSALTTLLPLAAASGIVQLSYTTPQIAFLSPSGNLIQLESSSSPRTGVSRNYASPTLLPAQLSVPAKVGLEAVSERVCLQPVRPALMPISKGSPNSLILLPPYLRRHHSYRHTQKSQIDSTESFIVPASAVKGCDGIVKSPSFTPRSGLLHEPLQAPTLFNRKRHRTAKSFARDLKFETRFFKARLTTTTSMPCKSSQGSKKHTTKSLASIYPRYKYGCFSLPRFSRAAMESAGGGSDSTDKESRRQSVKGQLAPLTGHALRICFCQPFDGVKFPTQTPTTDAPHVYSPSDAASHSCSAKTAHPTANMMYGDLPNSRVIKSHSGR